MKPFRPVLLLGLTLVVAPALAQQGIDSISDDIVTQAGQRYGNLGTVSGDIRLQAGAGAGSIETVSGDIRLDEGATADRVNTVSGDVEAAGKVAVRGIGTVSGDIYFGRGGRIDGDIGTVSGDIGLVASRVAGGVETVSGDVTVGIDSHVRGGITVKKPDNAGLSYQRKPPRIIIGPNAVVEGALVFERPVRLYVHRSARIGPVSGATAKTFDTPTAPRD